MSNQSTYPISAETARQLSRPLFGHVIDGEVVPSLEQPLLRPTVS